MAFHDFSDAIGSGSDASCSHPAQVADRFRILGTIGRGGMGTVFRAHDAATGETCALKVLRQKVAKASQSHVTRFRREYRAAKRLSHPHCVKALDFGYADASWYFTMELVEGCSLSKAVSLENLRPSVAEAVGLTMQILAGLDHVHSRNLVHRDIKPGNILLCEDPRRAESTVRLPLAKITDFGVARVGDLDDLVGAGGFIGSLPYHAPELLLGAWPDPRADLYAVGIVLFELLTGSHPYGNRWPVSPSGWRDLHAASTPPVPAEVAPDVPRAVSDVVARLLPTDPNARFRTAALAHDALGAWLEAHNAAVADEERVEPPQAPGLEGSPYLAGPRLIARQAELGKVCAFVEGALNYELATNMNQPSLRTAAAEPNAPLVLMIEGEAGAGKSRFVHLMVGLAEAEDAVVVLGECRSGIGSPYQSMSGLLRRLALLSRQSERALSKASDAQGNESRTEVLQGSSQDPSSEKEWLSSSWRGQDSQLKLYPDGSAVLATQARRREEFLRRTAERVVEDACKQPCLIIVEDGQWFDRESLELLAYIMRTCALAQREGQTAKLACVVTHRPEADNNRVAQLKESLMPLRSRTLSLSLPPFDQTATAELASTLLMQPLEAGVERFCQALFGRRSVTPLYVVQVLRYLLSRGLLLQGTRDETGRWRGHWNLAPEVAASADVPATVQAAIGDRATRLGVDTQNALATAAVAGPRFSAALLAEATELHPNEILDCLDEAESAGFVSQLGNTIVGHVESESVWGDTPATSPYQFVHDHHRQALYRQLTGERCRSLHRTLAEALARVEGDTPKNAGRLAQHYVGSEDWGLATTYALKAADWAFQQGTFERSVELFEVSFAHAAKANMEIAADAYERHADACVNVGRFEQAKKSYDVRLASLGNEPARLEVLRKAAEVNHRSGDFSDAAPPLIAALQRLGSPLPQSRVRFALELLLNVGETLVYGVLPFLIRKRKTKDRARRTIALRTWMALSESCVYVDFPRAVFAGFKQACLACRLGANRVSAGSFAMIAVAIAGVGFHRLSRRYLRLALERVDHQRPSDRTATLAYAATACMLAGQLSTATSLGLRAIEAARTAKDTLKTYLALVLAEPPLRGSGRFADAEAVAFRLAAIGDRAGIPHYRDYAAMMQACISLPTISKETSLEAFTQGLHSCASRNDQLGYLSAVTHMALAKGLRGDIDMSDLLDAVAAAEAWLRARFMGPSTAPLAATLASAALAQHSFGGLDQRLRQRLHRLRRGARQRCMANRCESTLYLGACAALEHLGGNNKAALRLLDKAQKRGMADQMLHHLAIVYRIGAIVLPADSQQAQSCQLAAKELCIQFAKHEPSAELLQILGRL